MTYLALGDSISIDDYTGVEGGGAASQLAKLLNADNFIDLTRDGAVSEGVVKELRSAEAIGHIPPIDVATITIGGNDLLSGYYFREIGERGAEIVALNRLRTNLEEIGEKLARLKCPVVINTIYDPTDGDDARATEMGLPVETRQALNGANALIRGVAKKHGFLLCDLEGLFHGHGFWSADPWIVMHIEPNLKGAEQIARAWHQILRDAGALERGNS